MSKLHELLAAEATVVQGAKKMVSETTAKFGKISEMYTGSIRTLAMINSSPENDAKEKAAKVVKELPSSVPDTLDYIWPLMGKALALKFAKHATNMLAKADVTVNGAVIIAQAPVDFLLDLERLIPEWRAMFIAMPTLDPSKEWITEGRPGVWKTKDATVAAHTEKKVFPVELSPATDKHPAQVKESSRDDVVGVFSTITFSGAATTDQKARALKLCDELLVAVKQARMRANNVDTVNGALAAKVLEPFSEIFKAS